MCLFWSTKPQAWLTLKVPLNCTYTTSRNILHCRHDTIPLFAVCFRVTQTLTMMGGERKTRFLEWKHFQMVQKNHTSLTCFRGFSLLTGCDHWDAAGIGEEKQPRCERQAKVNKIEPSVFSLSSRAAWTGPRPHFLISSSCFLSLIKRHHARKSTTS